MQTSLSKPFAPVALDRGNLPRLEEPRIVIVGGGIAGLVAAWELKKQGIEADVFEANTRLGGRVWSDRDKNGEIFERGGELINESHTELLELIRELGLETRELYSEDQTALNIEFHIEGRRYTQRELSAAIQPLVEKLRVDLELIQDPVRGPSRREELAHIRMSEYLDGVPDLPPWTVNAISTLMRCELCRDVASLPALLLLEYGFGSIGPDDDTMIGGGYGKYTTKGGNGRVIEALAGRLGGRIHTGSPLTSASTTEDGYELRFGDRIVQADIIIFAVPFAALRHVDLSELNLTPERDEAIKTLPTAEHAKIHVPGQSGRQGSPAHLIASDTFGFGWTRTRAEGEPGNRTLMVPLGCAPGEATLSSAKLPAGSREFDEVLEFCGGSHEPERTMITEWRKNTPFANGSYSTYGDFDFERLASGLGVHCYEEAGLYFAGEHVSGEDPELRGFMAGAVHTAKLAAGEAAELRSRIVASGVRQRSLSIARKG